MRSVCVWRHNEGGTPGFLFDMALFTHYVTLSISKTLRL